MAGSHRRWVETGDKAGDAPGDVRRNEIVEATWRLIATVGLDKTSMRRIAEEVSYTTGLVTHYFASKDDLLLAALQKISDMSSVRARAAREATGGPGAERVRALVLASLPLDDQVLLEWRVWMSFWARAYSNPRLQKEQQRYYRRWRQALQREVKEAEAAGAFPRSAGPDVETTHLVALVLGLSIDTVLSPGRIDRAGMTEVVDDHLARLS